MNTYIFINDTKQDVIDSVWAENIGEALEYAVALPDDEPTSITTVEGKSLDFDTVCHLYSEGAWK